MRGPERLDAFPCLRKLFISSSESSSLSEEHCATPERKINKPWLITGGIAGALLIIAGLIVPATPAYYLRLDCLPFVA